MAKLATEAKPCGEASGGASGKILWKNLVAKLATRQKLVAELVAKACGKSLWRS